jgi:hypothetical protein
MSRALILLLLLAVLLLPGTAFAVDVVVLDDGIDPDPVTAEVGEQVTFVNQGEDDVRLIDDEGRWDSGVLAPGESFTITFDAPDTVTFTSEDGSVTGTIEVGGGDVDPMGDPTEQVTTEPTAEATAEPTAEPTPTASPAPTATPTATPTASATPVAAPEGLAETGSPAAALGALAASGLLAGALLVRRGEGRSAR